MIRRRHANSSTGWIHDAVGATFVKCVSGLAIWGAGRDSDLPGASGLGIAWTLPSMPLTSSTGATSGGGPSITGDVATGVISMLTVVDDDDCDAWLPSSMCLAVEGRMSKRTVGPPR